jgi:HEAT repeat protein
LRAAAAEAAPALPDAEAVEALGRALSDESAVVRRAASRVLPRVAGAAPLLSRALVDRDPSVVAAACDAAAELKRPAVKARLAELLHAGEGFVVLAALQALVSLGAVDDEMAALALGHADPEVVKAALSLLAGAPRCASAAPRLLQHPRWDVRAAAARALEVAGSAEALEALKGALLREHDGMTRQIIAAAAERLSQR